MPSRTILVAAIASLSFAATAQAQFASPSSTEITATGGTSGDGFGSSVALDGDTCVIGAFGTNSFTGSAYVFTNTNGTWSQVAELTAASAGSLGFFSVGVAIDGDTCVASAPNATVDGTPSIGRVYFFTRTGGTWSQTAEFTGSSGTIETFGQSVALDGDTCVVGALFANGGTGGVYVFTRTGGTWSQTAELTPANGSGAQYFGSSVALDGSTCVIGASRTNSNTGSAYVFTNTNGTWSQVAELTAANGAGGDNFGDSVSLDGSTCVIGASRYFSPSDGSAYVFTNTNGTWSQVVELTAANEVPVDDRFGSSVALEGSTCVVGALRNNNSTGSAYVFTNTNGTWSQVAELTAANGASNDYFGSSVALDGGTSVIGAFGTNSLTGSVHILDFDGDSVVINDGTTGGTTTPGDVDGDGDVDTNDLSSLRSTLALCASDVDSDGDTDIEDLLSVISGYGGTTCP